MESKIYMIKTREREWKENHMYKINKRKREYKAKYYTKEGQERRGRGGGEGRGCI